jgi:hypothetical protein
MELVDTVSLSLIAHKLAMSPDACTLYRTSVPLSAARINMSTASKPTCLVFRVQARQKGMNALPRPWSCMGDCLNFCIILGYDRIHWYSGKVSLTSG